MAAFLFVWSVHHLMMPSHRLHPIQLEADSYFLHKIFWGCKPQQGKSIPKQGKFIPVRNWGIWFFKFFKFETALLELLKNADSEVVTANRFCTKKLPMNQISALPNPLKILFQEYNQGQIESVGFRSFKEILEAIRLMDAEERRELKRVLFA